MCIALIAVPFVFAGGCSLAVDVRSDDEFDDTDEELYHLQKCQASKTPLVHSDKIPLSRSCSLLLHQDNNDSSVTCHCHSK